MASVLDPELKRALAERVRYYNELGIYDFYRREPAEANLDTIQDAAILENPTTEPEQRDLMTPRSKAAIAVSGVSKLHAVLGGFHLGPAPIDYVEHTVAELKSLSPDVVVPMHCSGAKFILVMQREMPDRLVTTNIGSRFTFGV